MSDRAPPLGHKRPAEKNGRSEERPSSGRKRPGRAAASQSKIAIPRCNNMKKLRPVCKAQSITILDKTPQKPWKNMSQLPGFWLFCCLLQHLCDAIIVNILNAADSSHCRDCATKESRGSAIPQLKRLETPDGRCCVVRDCPGKFYSHPLRRPAPDRNRHRPLPPPPHHLHLRHPSGHPRLQGRNAD